mmetsp:Transcript_19045/g.54093  ORF Transcript_19045/g.54093 Transcript_19045/m.54093 type:complete len:205 (-) Transcript_19045:2906-3520(-)
MGRHQEAHGPAHGGQNPSLQLAQEGTCTTPRARRRIGNSRRLRWQRSLRPEGPTPRSIQILHIGQPTPKAGIGIIAHQTPEWQSPSHLPARCQSIHGSANLHTIRLKCQIHGIHRSHWHRKRSLEASPHSWNAGYRSGYDHRQHRIQCEFGSNGDTKRKINLCQNSRSWCRSYGWRGSRRCQSFQMERSIAWLLFGGWEFLLSM